MSWLKGRPVILNGWLISGDYDGATDDTKYYDVYTYPQLEYIGKFNSSRFNNPSAVRDRYPALKVDYNGHIQASELGEFRVFRDLFPSEIHSNQWLQFISWGFPDLIPIDEGDNVVYEVSVINGEPEPFDNIVKRIMETKKGKLYDKLHKF